MSKLSQQATQDQLAWWQKGVVYQIYPRSFQDSNGDGVGDLPGIIQRLDYVKSLNVDAIWLSPIYPSPMHDFGYDVADYRGIHPMFGTMDDFDRLLAEAHNRGLKVILDLVPNHSSDEHEWFVESRSSRDNPKRDWYIWRDPAPGSTPGNPIPPNNWISYFGGPAWTFDEETGQFYLHLFDTHQPDLNYRNPKVAEAMLAIMDFWLQKGVDGFRVDVIWLMYKDTAFRDMPDVPAWGGDDFQALVQYRFTGNLPEVHEMIRRMRALVDSHSSPDAERVLIGELYMPIEHLVTYYGQNGDECHLPFNFLLILMQGWNATTVQALVEAYEGALPPGGWPNWVIGNHDQHRVASRIGSAQARVAQMLLLTLRGTPTCYYGDEIGMVDGVIPPEKVQDPQALNQPEVAEQFGRDPERTPMQWDDSANAGFADAGVETWLPVADNYPQRNVAAQESADDSMLNFFRRLLALRQTHPALHGGDYATASAKNQPESVYSYTRTAGDERFLIVLNFGEGTHYLNFSELAQSGATGTILLSTGMKSSGSIDFSSVIVVPNEGLMIQLST